MFHGNISPTTQGFHTSLIHRNLKHFYEIYT